MGTPESLRNLSQFITPGLLCQRYQHNGRLHRRIRTSNGVAGRISDEGDCLAGWKWKFLGWMDEKR
jgi:hypothetical protein